MDIQCTHLVRPQVYLGGDTGMVIVTDECPHQVEQRVHLAGYSSASTGRIWWCALCGAISVTRKPDGPLDWTAPGEQGLEHLQKKL